MSDRPIPFKLKKERAEELEFAWNRLCQDATVEETITKIKHLTSLNPNDSEIAFLGYRLGQTHVVLDLKEENVHLGAGIAKMDWLYWRLMVPASVVAVLAALFTLWNAAGGYKVIASRNGWTPPAVQKAALPEYLKQKVYSEIILYNE